MVPLAAIPELHGAEDAADALTLGAATTHAAIADGRTPDISIAGQPVLARIAEGIAYRAVRTRGTLGGSLCHADPAADWLVTLTTLRATVLTTERAVPLDRFVAGPFRTVLRRARWCAPSASRGPGRMRAGATASCAASPGNSRTPWPPACWTPGERAS